MNRSRNNFILGLGHQKCGTSWVYSYLSRSRHFCQGMLKEYHIWDALDIPLLARNRVKKLQSGTNMKRSATSTSRYDMQNDTDTYFEYFCGLYSNTNNIAADITPSYSGLKRNRLQEIRDGFGKRGVDVKALILIRDPLRRIKSAVRFNLDRKNYSEGIINGELDFDRALEQYFMTEHCTLRTRYQVIIGEAEKVFNEEQLYVGIYENMFTFDEILRLSRFFGIDPDFEFARKKVNKTIGDVYETNIDSLVKAYYADVYDFCYENYPLTQKLWNNFQ